MNFSIHLPDPLLADLDAFAQTRQTSRRGVIREELPGLAKSGFDAVGQFGIGFYSVFMLGSLLGARDDPPVRAVGA